MATTVTWPATATGVYEVSIESGASDQVAMPDNEEFDTFKSPTERLLEVSKDEVDEKRRDA